MAWRVTVESIRMHIPRNWRLGKPLVDELASQQKRTTGSHKTLGMMYNLELEMVVGGDTIITEEKTAVHLLYWGRIPRLRSNMTLKPFTSPALYKPLENRYLVDRGG